MLSDRAYHIIRGEMLGMRALLHFEMLRIFGPIFAEAPVRVSIPYRTSSELTVTPLLPANEVAEKIDRDFTDGLAELAEWDPVRTEGRLNGSATGSVRYRSRHLRLNYFALKALRARLAIYVGDRKLAGQLAGEVIDEAGAFFPFASREDVTGRPPSVWLRRIPRTASSRRRRSFRQSTRNARATFTTSSSRTGSNRSTCSR